MDLSNNRNNDGTLVLFFPAGEEYLRSMVLDGIDYSIFDPAKDIDYRFSSLFKGLFSCVRENSLLFIGSWISIRKSKVLLRKIRAHVIAKQLQVLSPKVVLTFTDNSNVFHLVSEACGNIPFLAIQNGGRHLWCATDALPDPELKYNIDEYFCFGPQVQEMFERYEHNIQKYTNCGSLLGGAFFSTDEYRDIKQRKEYDICIVSQWAAHLFDKSKVPKEWIRLAEAIMLMTQHVAQYANENGLKVCVALRRDNAEERAFYDSYFNGNCIYQCSNDRLTYSSYKAGVASRLSVSINSTLASELFGAGERVLFVNPFSEDWLQPTKNIGDWCLTTSDYASFEKKASILLAKTDEEYFEDAKFEIRNSVSYDFDKPAHIVIRSRLLELIGSTTQDNKAVYADETQAIDA